MTSQNPAAEMIEAAWYEAYIDYQNKATKNKWQRFIEILKQAPDLEAILKECNRVFTETFPFSVVEFAPTMEDRNGRYYYDFEGEERYYLWTPTDRSKGRYLTPDEVTQRTRKDQYGAIFYDPDPTGEAYGLPENAAYFFEDLLIAYIRAANLLNEGSDYPMPNSILPNFIAAAAASVDPKTATREIIMKERRGIPGIEGIRIPTKAAPIIPEGDTFEGIYLTTNQPYNQYDKLMRDNALYPTRDHLFRYLCYLYQTKKPLRFTLNDFIRVCHLDPRNRNAAKAKLYAVLYDLKAYNLVLTNKDGYRTVIGIIRGFQLPPEDQMTEKEYGILFDPVTEGILSAEAKRYNLEKVPPAYFSIDDRHRTANAIASAFLQDESRNATREINPDPRVNPVERNAQNLMNEVYPRTQKDKAQSRTKTQIAPFFRDLRYLTTEAPVFIAFNFTKGNRLLTLKQAEATLTRWADFDGVHIEAVSGDPTRYKVKKERYAAHKAKEAAKKKNTPEKS